MAKNNEELAAKLVTAQANAGTQLPATQERRALNHYFEASEAQFGKALAGSGMDAARFARVCLTLVRNNAKLKEIALANPTSIIASCMEMAALGLDPAIPNEVFLVPYGHEAKSQTGYKGLAKLAIRAAREQGAPLSTLTYDTICKNDNYDRARGDSPYLRHSYPPFGTDRGEVLGYYAVSRNMEGAINFTEMTVDEVETHKRRFCKSPMLKLPENAVAYGMKTVVRRLINKYLPMSNRLATAISMDIDSEKGPDDPIAIEAEVVDPTKPVGEYNGKEEEFEGKQRSEDAQRQ